MSDKAENVNLRSTSLQDYASRIIFFQKINRGREIQDHKVSFISLAHMHVAQTH